MIIHVDENGFVNLESFSSMFDITKIVYYKLKLNRNKTLSLKFYDHKQRLVKPNVKISESQKRAGVAKKRTAKRKIRDQAS